MENQQFGSSSPRHGVWTGDWSDGFVAVQHDMWGIEHLYHPTISHPHVMRVSYLLLKHWYPLQRPLLNLYVWVVPIFSFFWGCGGKGLRGYLQLGVGLLGHRHFASATLMEPMSCPGEFCPFKHVQAEKNKNCLVVEPTNPSEKICKWVHLPQFFGVNIENIYVKTPPPIKTPPTPPGNNATYPPNWKFGKSLALLRTSKSRGYVFWFPGE